MSPHLHWRRSTLSVHTSPTSFQSVHLVSVTYTLPLSHIYIQAPVRLAEPMWVEHTSHLLGKYIHMTFWSPQVENLQVKVIFLWTSLAFSLLTQTQPCSSSARPHVFVPHFSAFSLSSHCLYQWLYPVFHSSSSILRYNTSLLVVLTQQLHLNHCLTSGIQQCVCWFLPHSHSCTVPSFCHILSLFTEVSQNSLVVPLWKVWSGIFPTLPPFHWYSLTPVKLNHF